MKRFIFHPLAPRTEYGPTRIGRDTKELYNLVDGESVTDALIGVFIKCVKTKLESRAVLILDMFTTMSMIQNIDNWQQNLECLYHDVWEAHGIVCTLNSGESQCVTLYIDADHSYRSRGNSLSQCV